MTGVGGKRRLVLLEPMAARGRMSGRGPQAQRSGRDEQSQTAKGSRNTSLLFSAGPGTKRLFDQDKPGGFSHVPV